MSSSSSKKRRHDSQLPVTVLSGFLGAGKTTLLKHILHTKHNTDGGTFKCAVIVNDMAELNIDKALVENIVQSDEPVVAMQNGCICCNLQSDLVEQITKLASSGKFDYMIIEGSGVTEPAMVAKVFADCEEDHDHEEHHGHGGEDDDTPTLGEVARLDTCVTVVDCSSMLTDLTVGPQNENLAKLMAEQIEYSNVILLNKTDLVSEKQLQDIHDRVLLLNPKAKVMPCQNSKIDVRDVVNTCLYHADAFEDTWTKLSDLTPSKEEEKKEEPSCCVAKKQNGQKPCCGEDDEASRTFRSDVSELTLAPGNNATRHSSRFGVHSFLYKARRPMHPGRFVTEFVGKYFVIHDTSDDEDCDEEEEEESQGGEPMEDEEEEKTDNMDMMEPKPTPEEIAEAIQKEASKKEKVRQSEVGYLLRTKGFCWIANSHDMVTTLSHAGNLVTMESPGPWTALSTNAYTGPKDVQDKLRRNWVGEWKDRRQELVFIGQNLKHKYIQAVLDECLLTDDEFEMGVDYWKATMGDVMLEIEP